MILSAVACVVFMRREASLGLTCTVPSLAERFKHLREHRELRPD